MGIHLCFYTICNCLAIVNFTGPNLVEEIFWEPLSTCDGIDDGVDSGHGDASWKATNLAQPSDGICALIQEISHNRSRF